MGNGDSFPMLKISGLVCPYLHQQGWFLEPFYTVLGPLTIFNHSNLRLRIDFFLLDFLNSIVLLTVVGCLPFLLEHPRWRLQCLACKQHWVDECAVPMPRAVAPQHSTLLIPCSKSSYLLWLCLFCNDITGKVRAFSFGIHSSMKSWF